jgi:hypothetical protein
MLARFCSEEGVAAESLRRRLRSYAAAVLVRLKMLPSRPECHRRERCLLTEIKADIPTLQAA